MPDIKHHGILGMKWGMTHRMSYSYNEEQKAAFMHYGILGMKWGVRGTDPPTLFARWERTSKNIDIKMFPKGQNSYTAPVPKIAMKLMDFLGRHLS